MAALSTIAALSMIGASAFQIGQSVFGGKDEKTPTAPSALPKAPDPNDAARKQMQAMTNRKGKAYIPGSASGRSATLLSGASGLSTPAPTERKTLLGQ